MRTLLAMAALLLFTGCSEYVTLRTSPPGAVVTVDGNPLGISPIEEAPMPREKLYNPPSYRVQLDGYKEVEGTFATRVSPGRIIGMVFTAGIVAIFRSPLYFQPVEIVLEPANIPVAGAGGTGTIDERLIKLRELYQRGLLTDQEYQRYRDEIVRGM